MDRKQCVENESARPRQAREGPGERAQEEQRRRVAQHGLVAEAVYQIAPQAYGGEVAELTCRGEDDDQRHRIAKRLQHIDGKEVQLDWKTISRLKFLS